MLYTTNEGGRMVTGQYVCLLETAGQFFGWINKETSHPYRLSFQFPREKEALSFSNCLGTEYQVNVNKNIVDVTLTKGNAK
jgi:hypothetical protein